MMEGVCSVTGLSRCNVVKDDDNELISDQWITIIVKTHELNEMNFRNWNLKTTVFKYGLDFNLAQVSYSNKTGLQHHPVHISVPTMTFKLFYRFLYNSVHNYRPSNLCISNFLQSGIPALWLNELVKLEQH
jgi:hypothetical protein